MVRCTTKQNMSQNNYFMNRYNFWIIILSLTTLSIYLFVTAPPPLESDGAYNKNTSKIHSSVLFRILNAENGVVRALWTSDMVSAGKQAGLQFSEDWQDASVDAGPLPALFLRETARSLEHNPSALSLFLGSDYPIRNSNRFEGIQLEKFSVLKQTQEPQFFYAPDIQRHIAMFPDMAVNDACVQCHNKHQQSSKNDWKKDDVMGAVTWMYPRDTLSFEELLKAISALHQGFWNAYGAYLEKARHFKYPPHIDNCWPKEGLYCIPTMEVFMQAVLERVSPDTMSELLKLEDKHR